MLTSFADSIHFEIATSTHFVYYNFMTSKEELVMILVNLSKQFYKGYEKEWERFTSEVESNRKVKEIVKNYFLTKELNITSFLSFLIPRVRNPEILRQLIVKSKPFMARLRGIAEGYGLVLEYNDFLYDLKNHFIDNPETEIQRPSDIEQFKLLAEPDFNVVPSTQETD